MREAYRYIQEMEERRIALHPYVDAAVLEAVYKAGGVGAGGPWGGRGPRDDADLGSTAGSADRLVLGGDGEEEEEEVMDEDMDEVSRSVSAWLILIGMSVLSGE